MPCTVRGPIYLEPSIPKAHLYKVKFHPSADNFFTQLLLVMLVANIMSGLVEHWRNTSCTSITIGNTSQHILLSPRICLQSIQIGKEISPLQMWKIAMHWCNSILPPLETMFQILALFPGIKSLFQHVFIYAKSMKIKDKSWFKLDN